MGAKSGVGSVASSIHGREAMSSRMTGGNRNIYLHTCICALHLQLVQATAVAEE